MAFAVAFAEYLGFPKAFFAKGKVFHAVFIRVNNRAYCLFIISCDPQVKILIQ